MFRYPYGNTQALNLDWLLKEWREYQSTIENMIAPQYSKNAQYEARTRVIYEHKLYYNPELDGDALTESNCPSDSELITVEV